MHALRSSLFRLPLICWNDSQSHSQGLVSIKIFEHGNFTWKELGHLQVYTLYFTKVASIDAFCSSKPWCFARGQKKYLSSHTQNNKDSWLNAKKHFSPAELQPRLKISSCINCGKHRHIFDACTIRMPLWLLVMLAFDTNLNLFSYVINWFIPMKRYVKGTTRPSISNFQPHACIFDKQACWLKKKNISDLYWFLLYLIRMLWYQGKNSQSMMSQENHCIATHLVH
jgi:hypothetical protein